MNLGISDAHVSLITVRFWALTACFGLLIPTSHHAQSTAAAVVKQVDHVMIRTNDRERLVSLLVDTLKLPVVWPLPGSTWTFSTGVALGDVNLEITPSRRAVDTRLADIAFQPIDFATASHRLKLRGLDPRDPGGYTDSAGVKRWSTLGFRHPFTGIGFFIVQYHQFGMDERRARFDDALRKRKGGPLGFRRIVEFRLAYSPDSMSIVEASWGRLLGNGGAGAVKRFSPSAGPAIRLVPSRGPNSSSFLVEVESLAEAELAAKSLKLVLSADGDSISLDPKRFGGLRLILVGRSRMP